MAQKPEQKVLLVEDTLCQANLVCSYLGNAGYQTDHAATMAKARQLFSRNNYDMVLLDMGLPDGSGADLLAEWQQLKPQTAIIVLTANASVRDAVKAVKNGAADYIVKPARRETLLEALANAAEHTCAQEPAGKAGRKDNGKKSGKVAFTGNSAPMQEVFEKIGYFANSGAPVFITGESGTGKELCARAIHDESRRRDGPFIALNCGAIPKDLMESEFFGHLKGAFTGAVCNRDGAARLADGGTLFLDEICELEYHLQTKLLRFLQSGMIQPVGTAKAERVDVRIICATNKAPLDEVKASRFRQDLYYRLYVLALDVPPLRARGRDVVLIGEHFRALYNELEGKTFERFSGDCVDAMLRYSWPGNVRELQNRVRQAVVLNDGVELTAQMLSVRPDETPVIDLDFSAFQTGGAAGPVRKFPRLCEVERQAIETAIAACKGSIPKAARLLDVSPSTIYRKLEAWQ